MNQQTAELMETPQEPVKWRFSNPLNPPIHYVARRFGGKKAKELERFLKFAIVGASGAIIDFGILIVLQATILPPTQVIHVVIASGTAFTAAVISNFVWTRYWVYPESKNNPIRKQLTQFALISVIGGAGRLLWIAAMYYQIGHLFMPLALPFIQIFRPNYIPSQTAEEKLGTIIAQM
ncbi:MAG: GtrA family protein, partial [Anaerolineae bacterium]|nr:GtrA family protein [Anaerolineae bacterium]